MPELSPTAQTVLTAVTQSEYCLDPSDLPNEAARMASIAAAALRAVADQVVPEETTPWNSTLTPMVSAVDVRAQFLAIAAELNGDSNV